MKPTTGCQSLVKQLHYSSFYCEVMANGRHHEGLARLQVGREVGLSIELCGLPINKEKYFLGGTSDGLVASDGLIEIKCPSSAKYMSPDEAILARKVTSWTKKRLWDWQLQQKSRLLFLILAEQHDRKTQKVLFQLSLARHYRPSPWPIYAHQKSAIWRLEKVWRKTELVTS